ncbi:50S ribosomal protein L15 [Patescibacteria group bacterium]|nr:50S ribosomal protein L15 [Patescibacteria group bacterium]
MNFLSQLPKIAQKSKKRLGRGYGSGRGGHTSGRGAKGDKARGKTKLTFDGSKIKKGWIKRTPFLRGKHRLLPQKTILTFTLDQLNKWFKDKDTVNPTSLSLASGLSFTGKKVKILSGGKIKKALRLQQIPLSKTASQKIVKAGGQVS